MSLYLHCAPSENAASPALSERRVHAAGVVRAIAVACILLTLTTRLSKSFGAEPRYQARTATNLLAEIPIEKDGGPILFRARIDFSGDVIASDRGHDEEYTLLLDTGAAQSCFDLSLRQLLGQPIATLANATLPQQKAIDTFRSPTLRIGSLRFQSAGNISCIDLKWLSDGLGQKVDGLFGMDLLADRVISIDFDEGVLRFCRVLPPDFGKPITIALKGTAGARRPFVLAALNGNVWQQFLIDTGGISNISGVLRKDVFERLFNRGVLVAAVPARLQPESARIATRTGMVDVPIARAELLSIGDYKNRLPLFAPHPRESILGLGVLSRYSVAFDFPNEVMYLRPGNGFERRDVWYDLTSFAVSKDNDRVVVGNLRTGGWGARAGLREGDVLLAINDRNTSDLSIFAIRRMLATELHAIFDIQRGGANQRIVLDLTPEVQRLLGDEGSQSPEVSDPRSRRKERSVEAKEAATNCISPVDLDRPRRRDR